MTHQGMPLLALTLACGPTPSPGMEAASREFAELARAELEDRAEIAALHEQATDLRLRADAVVTVWRASEQDFRQATDAYEAATAAGPAVNAQFQAAIADFQHAERRYRLTVLLVAAVAASGHLCATTVSTRNLRAQLRADGVDLGGKDIDHIWPRSLGGIDHPLNYQVLDSHLNRSLGAGVVQKFLTQPLALVQGLAVSALSALSC